MCDHSDINTDIILDKLFEMFVSVINQLKIIIIVIVNAPVFVFCSMMSVLQDWQFCLRQFTWLCDEICLLYTSDAADE